MGESPWRPNRVIELFRKNVRELLLECGAEDDPESAPTFDLLEDMFSSVKRLVESAEVWDEASGALYPRRAVYVPPSFFGARALQPEEREERRIAELAEEVRVLEEEIRAEESAVEGPGGVEASASPPAPPADGAERAEGASGGAGGELGEVGGRRKKRSAAQRERRRRAAEEKQKALEEAEREALRLKEEEEEARAVLRLAAARKRFDKEENKRKRKAEERNRLKEEEEKKKREELAARKEEEEKRKAEEGRRPGKKWAPWWAVKEAKKAEREVKRLEEEVGKARKLAAEKRQSLGGLPAPGSSDPPAPGPSGVVGVGHGRGGPWGSASAVVAPRGG